MKRTGTILACATVVASTLLVSAHAQYASLDSGWSICGAAVETGDVLSTTYEFKSGIRYTIEAGGGDGARDIDLEIVDSSGKVVVRDVSYGVDAVVSFTPSRSGMYTIRLIAEEVRGEALAYYFVSSSSGGWRVPESDITAAIARFAAMTVVLGELASKTPKRFYGCVLRPGESRSMTFSNLPSGSHIFSAVGDDLARDIDLVVLRGSSRVGIDDDYDATPLVGVRGSGSYTARVEYVSGSGPALIILGLYSD